MDDYNFQQELHTLKQRVSNLCSYQREPFPQAASPNPLQPCDSFSDQLNDLKAHLASMRDSLTSCEISILQTSGALWPNEHPLGQTSFLPNSRLKLPSGPLFWQLYNSLRTDVQGLDGRVAAVEQSVSDLEDRVDRLNPVFTPTSSEFGFDDPLPYAYYGPELTPPTLSELCSDVPPNFGKQQQIKVCAAKATRELPQVAQQETKQQDQGSRPILSDALSYLDQVRAHNSNCPDVYNRFLEVMNDFKSGVIDTSEVLRRVSALFPGKPELIEGFNTFLPPGYHIECGGGNHPGVIKLTTPTGTMPQYLLEPNVLRKPQDGEASLRDDILATNSAIGRLHQENYDMQTRINKLDLENENLVYAVRELTDNVLRRPQQAFPALELPTQPQPQPQVTESVAFRDREIARMDEQLRIAQDRLRVSEENMAQKDAAIVQLRESREDHQARAFDLSQTNLELNDQLTKHSDALQTKYAEIKDLQSNITDKDVALRSWQESWREINACYNHAHAKANAYERRLRDMQDQEQDRVDRMVADHQKELHRLQEFCEQKDAVVYKQEEIIARGGQLMEQRDEELESLQRKLRSVEDDNGHATRTQERLQRLLRERDFEITYLKGRTERSQDIVPERKLPQAYYDKREHGLTGPCNRDDEHPGFSAPPVPSDGGAQLHAQQHQWVPKNLRGFAWQPHGERRAYSMEAKAHEQNYGQSTAVPSVGERRRRGRVEHRQRLAPQPRGRQDWSSGSLGTKEAFRRDSESGTGPVSPLSDQYRHSQGPKTFRPLPAPVAARRMALEADLRTPGLANSATPAARSLSKHQSMQDLLRKRLQAYVETEAESGEEFGEEV